MHRGGHDATIVFHRARPGEVFLDVTVSARGVNWARRGHESAVVSAYVDGHYATDIVITSDQPVTRQFALGHARRRSRTCCALHYPRRRSRSRRAGCPSARQSPSGAVRPDDPTYARRSRPVLYGRNVAVIRRPLQNNRTDTPLIAWHQTLPARQAGHPVIEYSVVLEQRGRRRPAPALMAQWGRTTDIEWIYRVEVDAHGRRVPGSGGSRQPTTDRDVPRSRTTARHPLLQTCTSNNNVCDSVR